MKRIQSDYLFDPEINAGKMIFLSGPRQVGKTFLVKSRLAETGNTTLYFNWDDPLVRREYVKNPHFLKAPIAQSAAGTRPLVAFDEIHKHKDWKNILKGLYDLHAPEVQFIVTGSARLDYFKASGDSLIGRHFSYKLLPIGLAEAAENFSAVINDPGIFIAPEKMELLSRLPADRSLKEAFAHWLHFGGFPEPFLRAKESFSHKWRRDYRSLLTSEDLRDLTRIHDLKGIEQLMLMLPEKIGSPLSVNSLREDLRVNHTTVANWLEALKKIFLVFSIMPHAKSISRAIAKEPKYYFYDWTMVDDPGVRFENAVAVSLLRLVNRWNELGLGDFDLRYVRNTQKLEVDFVLTKNTKPIALLESKLSDTAISPACRLFSDTLKIPCYQLVARDDTVTAFPGNRFIVPAWRILGIFG